MHDCVACGRSKAKGAYSQTQWKKRAHGPKCKGCVSASLQRNQTEGFWTEAEDQRLKELLEVEGTGEWNRKAVLFPGRTGKGLHNRWGRAVGESFVILQTLSLHRYWNAY